jgi:hypothetical protein
VSSDGRINPFSFVNLSLTTEADLPHYDVSPGGHWSPHHCIARQRLAVIIPFRDREAHLPVLLQVLHPMLQRQQIDYTIFVVEQVSRTKVLKTCLIGGFVAVICCQKR